MTIFAHVFYESEEPPLTMLKPMLYSHLIWLKVFSNAESRLKRFQDCLGIIKGKPVERRGHKAIGPYRLTRRAASCQSTAKVCLLQKPILCENLYKE